MSPKIQTNPLLCRAFLYLTPDAFFHPIWRNFVKPLQSFSSGLIHNLLNIVPSLQSDAHCSAACQVLLVCAYLHNQIGNPASAIQCVHQAFLVAKRESLIQEALWSTWGASSIHLKNSEFGSAADYLQLSQSLLLEQNDWILANYVAVIHDVIQNLSHSEQKVDHQLLLARFQDPVIKVTLAWMLNWGAYSNEIINPQRASKSQEHLPDGPKANKNSPRVNGVKFWRSPWKFLQDLIFNGSDAGSSNLQEAIHSMSDPFQETWIAPSPTIDQSTLSVHSREPASEISNILETIAEDQDSISLKSEPIPSNISFTIYFLGHFRVFINDRIIEKWPGNKGKQIFKYLVVHRRQPVHHEVLIDLLWPEMDPEAARRNLYQAIYSLRQVLQNNDPSFDYILTEESHYRLNPEAEYWVDCEAFDHHYQSGQELMRAGRNKEAIKALKMAENLYGGEFLAEDRYEDWPLVRRENITHAYLNILDRLSRYYLEHKQWTVSINYSHKILSEDSCREDAHRRIMRGYLAQGQPDLAIRQYHICLESLKRELGVPPMPATTKLFDQIKKVRSQILHP